MADKNKSSVDNLVSIEYSRNVENQAWMLRALAALLKPPERLTPTEWAEKYRVLRPEYSAQPGLYRVAVTPYCEAPMNAMDPAHPAKKVTVVFPSQVGKSTLIENLFGWIVACHPGPIMVVNPSDNDAMEAMDTRFQPMIEDVPGLREKFLGLDNDEAGAAKTKGVQRKLFKQFLGGTAYFKGTGSSAKFRAKSIRWLFLDEIDAFRDTPEGDPLVLFAGRTTAYGEHAKTFQSSTPTSESGRVWQEYLSSDQHEFWFRFPCCGTYQRLVFQGGLIAPSRSQSGEVAYQCCACGVEHPEEIKREIWPTIQARPWIENAGLRQSAMEAAAAELMLPMVPDAPTWEIVNTESWKKIASPTNGRHLGFHVSGLLAPLGGLSWAQIWNEFEDATRTGDKGKLQAWTNIRMAEPWVDNIAGSIKESELFVYCKNYERSVPLDVGVLTAGVDVQKDRLEVGIWGWDANGAPWQIDYRRFHGDTKDHADPCYARVWEFLRSDFDGVRVGAVCWDTGYNTTAVHLFLRDKLKYRVFPIKGENTDRAPIWQPRGRKNKDGGTYFRVGTVQAKINIFQRLQVPASNPASFKFPATLPDAGEFFAQLVSERMETSRKGGQLRYSFVQVRARNEVLDTVVYALAALKALEMEGLKLPVAVEDRARREERASRRLTEPAPVQVVAPRQRVVPGYERETF